MSLALEIRVEMRVLRDRVIYRMGPMHPWTVLGRIERCPCCGTPAKFLEA